MREARTVQEKLVHEKLDYIIQLLHRVVQLEGHEMAILDDLTTEVEETKTVQASAIALLQGLKAKLDAAIASGNPAALKALSDALNVSSNDLAAAITANTPAEPPPTP